MEEEAPKKRGRPKGSFSKASKAQVARLTSGGKLSPSVPSVDLPERSRRYPTQDDAAKAAAPYVHARLSTEVNAAVTEVSHEEWLKT